jgi:hypothetical protein
VKTLCADASVDFVDVKVGHCQALNLMNETPIGESWWGFSLFERPKPIERLRMFGEQPVQWRQSIGVLAVLQITKRPAISSIRIGNRECTHIARWEIANARTLRAT